MRSDILTQPLFSPKLLKSRFNAQPLPDTHRALIAEWHQSLKGGLGKTKEESIRPAFLQRFFVDILGYQQTGGMVWSIDHETYAAGGKVDAALGAFTYDLKQVIVPFELKGPKTSNLDALMPARSWQFNADAASCDAAHRTVPCSKHSPLSSISSRTDFELCSNCSGQVDFDGYANHSTRNVCNSGRSAESAALFRAV